MNMCMYRTARSVYHGLSPQERINMTPERLAALIAEKRNPVNFAGGRCLQ